MAMFRSSSHWAASESDTGRGRCPDRGRGSDRGRSRGRGPPANHQRRLAALAREFAPLP